MDISDCSESDTDHTATDTLGISTGGVTIFHPSGSFKRPDGRHLMETSNKSCIVLMAERDRH